MMRVQGNILIIVLIIVGALYLLASMMFTVNQQYFSDMLMAKSAAKQRQKLLSVGLEKMQPMSKVIGDYQNTDEWQECDVLAFPNMSQQDAVFSQKAPLANHCHDDGVAHRIWLASSDQLGDRLIIDQLVAKDDWQSEIKDKHYSAKLIKADVGWLLILDNDGYHKEITLIASDDLPHLVDHAMRIHQMHYEIVLVFEDDINQKVMLYHLWIPMAELHFDMSMVFQFHLNQYVVNDHVDIVTMNINDVRNPNWQMKIDQKHFEAMLIKNHVVFVVLHSKGSIHQSIIGMYLNGQPFFDERVVGFEYFPHDQVIELIPCLYRLPLVVAGQWQIGCDVQQKIRYYFLE